MCLSSRFTGTVCEGTAPVRQRHSRERQGQRTAEERRAVQGRLRAVGAAGAGSVEADCVEEGPAALLLELLQQLVDLVLHVLRVLNALAELTDEEGPQRGLLVVVLDVHVDHVHGLAGLLLPGIQIFHHLVVHPLFTGKDQVKQVFAVLEPFWPGLDSLVSVQHVQNAILRVEFFVLPEEVVVHRGAVRRPAGCADTGIRKICQELCSWRVDC